MSKPQARPGPRGLSPDVIARAAIGLLEEGGEAGFSLRKVGQRVGCDPMTVLYHFGSKEGLERAMADALNAELKPVARDRPWRERLADLAFQYQALAARYPRTFPLLQRFWVTGPADYRHAEMIYEALGDAGFADEQMVDICFGWYAGVLGLAAAEAGGLLKPAGPDHLAEVAVLPDADFPITKRLVPAFEAQTAGRAYARMVEVILDGIEGTKRTGA
jgi:AcrR family transcriptional regulator